MPGQGRGGGPASHDEAQARHGLQFRLFWLRESRCKVLLAANLAALSYPPEKESKSVVKLSSVYASFGLFQYRTTLTVKVEYIECEHVLES